MASSLISSSHHVDFESIFGFDDAGMVQMFATLITTGLKNFLGCPTVFYEAALTEFFTNGSVRDGLVVSTTNGVTVEISEQVFAAAFDLPIDGLTDLLDEMKIEYRLLHDILAKTLFGKAGSFDAVTHERFMLMTAITFDVKVNWSSLLFGVLKAMVTPGSRQARGFAVQIGVILKNVPGLALGEYRAFPDSRVLTEKTIHRYVFVNDKVGGEADTDAPRVKKTPVKKTVSKKRPAGDVEMAPIVKKKRTTKGNPAAAKSLPVEEPVSTTSEKPVAEVATGDADAAIEQVLAQLDLVFKDSDVERSDRAETWTVSEAGGSKNFGVDKAGEKSMGSKQSAEEHMSIDDLLMQISEDMMLPSVTAAEITKIRLGESINIPGVQERDPYYASLPRISLHGKGKEILEEAEPIKGNPARESVELICGDVDFLVQLRNKVMQDVVEFFHSFSLNKLSDLDNLKILKEKEKLMLEWAETDSLEMAVKRKMYILAKYQEMILRKFLDSHRKYFAPGQTWTAMEAQIIDMLTSAHSKSLEALQAEQQLHRIEMTQPGSSLSDGPGNRITKQIGVQKGGG
ncbi:hypothetical protein F511_39024 [Dorcoceras hygrometricum]|uniref:Delphilin-like n=1 Tax=Dorcoceras hygrometricum TaxID=472368 RepID=A0A2Z7C360_9LAMI|nr:hypothetical protein F511_39024 [Dorcoceras hygrometricum]